MDKIKEFWDRVKVLIKANNTTQEGLANSIGKPFHTLQGQIAKNRAPDVFDAFNIAKTLCTSIEYLVTGNTISQFLQISDEDKQLLQDFHNLTFGNQLSVKAVITTLLTQGILQEKSASIVG